MNSTKASRRTHLAGTRPAPRRTAGVAVGISVFALVAALLAAPAHATDAEPGPSSTTTDPAPTATETSAPTPEAAATAVPDPSTETTAPTDPLTDSVPQTGQVIERAAVPTAATGFSLQYAFEPGVQPSNVQRSSDVESEASYDWSAGEVHYLQWDYPMPEDGTHAVSLTAQLVDFGTLTDYAVRYTSTVNRTAGSLTVQTDCAILLGDEPVADADGAPFTCEGGSVQGASGAVLAGANVAPLNWASITGIIDVRNQGTGPRISLGEGTFSTANQEGRIIMNGAAWYPVDASVADQRALPYATIGNGAQVTWMAAQQNRDVVQTEPDSHAQASFAYRIYLDDVETDFWISGFAESYKFDSWTYPSASCDVYLGDPNGIGKRVVQATPFTCEPTAMTKPNVKTDDDTTFQVRMVPVDTLTKQSDAKIRGVDEACGAGGQGCVQSVGAPHLHVSDASKPRTIEVNPNTQGAPEPKEWKFEKTWSREVTDSVEQTFGVTYSYEVEVEIAPGVTEKEGIELSSETSYGYDLSKGLEYSFSDYAKIPYGAIGSYVQFDAWNTYSGDLYFFGEGGSWYRVTGTTITVPIDPDSYGESNIFDGHIDAKAGASIGQVQFQCVWDASNEAKVLLNNSTVEELTACSIPAEWGDTVPDVDGLEVAPDLIQKSRAILANELSQKNDVLQNQAEALAAEGGE